MNAKKMRIVLVLFMGIVFILAGIISIGVLNGPNAEIEAIPKDKPVFLIEECNAAWTPYYNCYVIMPNGNTYLVDLKDKYMNGGVKIQDRDAIVARDYSNEKVERAYANDIMNKALKLVNDVPHELKYESKAVGNDMGSTVLYMITYDESGTPVYTKISAVGDMYYRPKDANAKELAKLFQVYAEDR